MAKILIADDDPDILKTVTVRLRAEGHEVIPVWDCNQAIKGAYAHSPDVILMDIKMPNIGGIKAFESLKLYSRTENIPVIFITAFAGEEVEKECKSKGAADFLSKPFETETLLEKIESVLKRRELETMFA